MMSASTPNQHSENDKNKKDKKVSMPSLNDNSNPQQGTSGSRTPPAVNKPTVIGSENGIIQQRAPLKIPPTVKDARKLFVGGLPSDVTSEEFRSFFGQFGKVMDSVVMFDRITSRSRGFGFVTFEDAAACKRLLGIGRVEMRGKFVEIKAAEPKSSSDMRGNRGADMSSPSIMKASPRAATPAIDVNYDSMVMAPPFSPSAAPCTGVPPPPFYPVHYNSTLMMPPPPGTYLPAPPMMPPYEHSGAYYAPNTYNVPNVAYGFVPVFYPDASTVYYPPYLDSVMQEVAPGIPAKPDEGGDGYE